MPPRPAPAGRRAQAVASVHHALRDNAQAPGKRDESGDERNGDGDRDDDNGDRGSNFGQSNPNSSPSSPRPSNSDSSSSGSSIPGSSNSGFGSSNSGSSNSSFPSNFGCLTCVVRDNDARVLYKGAWSLDGNPVFTTHSTVTPGSSVSFKFNGSAIVVFGTVPQSNSTNPPPTASYVLDAAEPFITTEPSASRNVPSQPLFAAFQLSPEEHTITINIQKARAPYILERFFVFPRGNLTQQAVDANHPSPTPSFGITTTPVPKAQSATTDSQVTVRVLAGILGSLVAIIILTGLYLLYIRRCRRKASLSLMSESPPSSSRGLRDTIFTSTESILRNNPSSMWSHYTQSEAGRGSMAEYYQTLPPVPPPLPPKA